jgi:hypothetical protein
VLYSHKDDLVYVNPIEEDGQVLTTFGTLPALKGDFLITHIDGTTRIISEKELNESYVPVEKVDKPKIDLEQMALNYANIEEWSTIEEEDYISRFQESVRKRNKNN